MWLEKLSEEIQYQKEIYIEPNIRCLNAFQLFVQYHSLYFGHVVVSVDLNSCHIMRVSMNANIKSNFCLCIIQNTFNFTYGDIAFICKLKKRRTFYFSIFLFGQNDDFPFLTNISDLLTMVTG